MFKFIFALTFISFATFISASQSQAADTDFTSKCVEFGTIPGGYCIHTPSHTRSKNILYYFHGLGGSESTWQEKWYYTSQIRNEWNKMHAEWPTVVSISFGPTWLLAEKNASPYSGLYDVITKQVIPQIEAQLNSKRGRRILMGESMGGFNTAQLALKWNFFSRAAILCAPMSQVSPFSTPEEIQKYVETTSAWQYYKDHNVEELLSSVKEAVQLSRAIFPTPTDWSSGDPVALAAHPTNKPELYVTDGYYDRFASFEATEVFNENLRKNRVPLEWHPLWGGHCTMDIPSLAKFLVRR